MKGRVSKLLALALAATMTLSLGACGGTSKSGINDLYTYEVQSNEMEGFLILNTEKSADLNVLCNAYSSLLTNDAAGNLIAEAAEKWGTEDGGTTWTFNLRKGIKWVDVNGNEKADCTAADWVTGLEWVLNFHKNGGNNTSMPVQTIKGAEAYYEYTKALSEEEAKALGTEKFLEMVGIATPDDYTIVYTCLDQIAYFPTLATCACLYPLSQALVDELGIDNVIGMSNETMWYNGPYTITSYHNMNEKVLTKNPQYWDKDCDLFDTVTIKMITDTTVGYQLYENGEIDHIDLSEATLKLIYEDENHKFHNNLVEKLPKKYSYQIHFNYDKHFEDGTPDTNWNTAVANENFRKALYYGMDLTAYWERTNFINPISCENLAYTMRGVGVLSDGTDYVDLVLEGLGYEPDGENPTRYDAEEAAEYIAKAKKELAAEGVTFPIELDHWIKSGSQSTLDSAQVFAQVVEDALGTDFIKVNIKTFVSTFSKDVTPGRLHSIANNGWGADYGDIVNFLGQETYGEDTAYYSMSYSNINDATDPELIAVYEEYTRLVNEADAIRDNLDERYTAFAKAEVYMLEHALTIPLSYSVSWQLTKVNDHSKVNVVYGCQNYRYKNWETSVEAYTTEEYKELAANK